MPKIVGLHARPIASRERGAKTPEQRRSLQLLAGTSRGVTDAAFLAHGFHARDAGCACSAESSSDTLAGVTYVKRRELPVLAVCDAVAPAMLSGTR